MVETTPLEHYQCPHQPHMFVVTCKAIRPSRTDLWEQSSLCAICAGHLIVLLQQLVPRVETTPPGREPAETDGSETG